MKPKLNNLFVFFENTFINIIGSKVLFYNSINGNKLIYDDDEIVALLQKKMNRIFYFLQLDNINEKIKEFINNCEKNNLGILLHTKEFPVAFKPEIKNIKYVPEKLVFEIKEIVIEWKEITEVHISKVKEFLNPLIISNLFFKLKIYIEDDTSINFLSALGELFIQKNIEVVFVINIKFLEKYLYLLKKFDAAFEILINATYFDFNKIDIIEKNIYERIEKITFQITNIKQYETIKNKILNYKNIKIKPIFDNNIDFFSKYIFLEEDEIKELHPTKIEVIKNKTLNVNFFGKIYIASNGKVLCNKYSDEIGSIYEDSIFNIIGKEVRLGKCWFLTRKQVYPCNKCIYNIICPPISEYEFALNKYNLCKTPINYEKTTD